MNAEFEHIFKDGNRGTIKVEKVITSDIQDEEIIHLDLTITKNNSLIFSNTRFGLVYSMPQNDICITTKEPPFALDDENIENGDILVVTNNYKLIDYIWKASGEKILYGLFTFTSKFNGYGYDNAEYGNNDNVE